MRVFAQICAEDKRQMSEARLERIRGQRERAVKESWNEALEQEFVGCSDDELRLWSAITLEPALRRELAPDRPS